MLSRISRMVLIVHWISGVSASAVVAETARQPLLVDQTDGGGYAALVIKQGRLGGQDAVYGGGQGGWQVHERLLLGLGAWSLMNKVTPERDDQYDRSAMTMVYGGLFAEARLYTWNYLSAVAYGLVASGDLGYRESVLAVGGEREWRHDNLSVVEGGVSLLLHATPRADWEIGYGRQSVRGLGLDGLKDNSSGGGTLTFGLRGVF